MNLLKITVKGNWDTAYIRFVVENQGETTHCVNESALDYHLNSVIGLDDVASASIKHVLMFEPVVQIDLNHTQRRVS